MRIALLPEHSRILTRLITMVSTGAIAGVLAYVALKVYRQMSLEADELSLESMRMSGELSTERALMRSLLENTPDHIYFKDAEGRFIRANKSFAESVGAEKPSDLVGKTEEDLLDPEAAKRNAEEDREVFRTGRPVVGQEASRTRPDGAKEWYSAIRMPLRDRHGNRVGTFAIFRNITIRRNAAEALRQLSQAVEQSPSVVLITDISGNITYVNPKFTSLTGYTRDEVTGRNPRILKAAGMAEEVYIDMWATISAGRVWNGEILNRKKSGDQFWGLASISPIRDELGRITHFLEVMEDITARKKAEVALRDQVIFQRQLMDAVPIPIFHKNADGLYRDCNRAFEKFIGRPQEEIIGRTVFDITPKALADVYSERDRQLMERGGAQQYESAVRHADGTYHEVMFTKAALVDADGKPGGLVGALLDLTELKKTQEALRDEYEKRAELERIISKSPAIVFLRNYREGWPVEYVSDSIIQLGYKTSDFLGEDGIPYIRLMHPGDVPRVTADVDRHVRLGHAEFTLEYRVFSKRGDVCWLEDRTWVRRNAAGEISHLQGIVMDVTSRKAAREHELATIEGLRTIINMTETLIECTSVDNLYRRAVELVREKLGFERTSIFIREGDRVRGTYGTNLKGQTTDEKDHVMPLADMWAERFTPPAPGGDLWQVVEEPYRVWEGGSMADFGRGWIVVTRILNHQHGVIGVFCNDTAISGAPVDEVKQELLAVFCTILGNIIARRLAEDERREAEEKHWELMERSDRLNALGILAAGMAHEINNPLQGMVSHIHAVQRSVEHDRTVRQSLEMVEKGIDTIAGLVRKLLLLGRTQEQADESVDAREAVEFVTQLLQSQLRKGGIRIVKKGMNRPLFLAAPRRYLIQVLLNLVINARDAMPDGGDVVIELQADNETGRIVVRDQGCGMDEQELAGIFKPFYSTKGTKGTGLGLSVADSLIRGSGGSIEVDSRKGEGTTFMIHLPRAGVQSA